MSYRILLVDSSLTAPAIAERALVNADYRVAAVSTFDQATRQIALDCPDLLITALRLQAFNGLHLLLRIRGDRLAIPVIVTGDLGDFTPDIGRFGARFVTNPVDHVFLIKTVSELLAGRTPRDPDSERRWPRKVAGLPAVVHDVFARVVELSYGGLRLELTTSLGDHQTPLEIVLPTLGLSVKAVSRWSKPLADGESWWCGAELALAPPDAARTWRWIVDSVN